MGTDMSIFDEVPGETENRGGKRERAGAPKKADRHGTAIQQAEAKIADRLPYIVDALIRLAEGHSVFIQDKLTGEKMVYDKPPDFKAAAYLVDRLCGKPHTKQVIAVDIRDFSKYSDEELEAIRSGQGGT